MQIKESMSEDIKQVIEQYGVVDEGLIISESDLINREEVVICQDRELLKSSWNTDEN